MSQRAASPGLLPCECELGGGSHAKFIRPRPPAQRLLLHPRPRQIGGHSSGCHNQRQPYNRGEATAGAEHNSSKKNKAGGCKQELDSSST